MKTRLTRFAIGCAISESLQPVKSVHSQSRAVVLSFLAVPIAIKIASGELSEIGDKNIFLGGTKNERG